MYATTVTMLCVVICGYIVSCCWFFPYQIASYGGDPIQMHLCGQSAGAHLGAAYLLRRAKLLHIRKSAIGSNIDSVAYLGEPSNGAADILGIDAFADARTNDLIYPILRSFIGVSGPFEVSSGFIKTLSDRGPQVKLLFVCNILEFCYYAVILLIM